MSLSLGDVHLISRRMLIVSAFAPVAQLDRALACGAKGHTFESCRVYHCEIKPSLRSFFICCELVRASSNFISTRDAF